MIQHISGHAASTPGDTSRWCEAITGLLAADVSAPRDHQQAAMSLLGAAREVIGAAQACWVCADNRPGIRMSTGLEADAVPPMHPQSVARLLQHIAGPVCCTPKTDNDTDSDRDRLTSEGLDACVVVVPLRSILTSEERSEGAPCTEALCFWTPGRLTFDWGNHWQQLLRATATALVRAGVSERVGSPARLEADQQEAMDRFRLCDSLTGLPSRVALEAAVGDAIEKMHDDPAHHFALYLLDFDGFQTVNMGLGMRAGDELLKQIGARLNRAVDTLECAQRQRGACGQRLVARVGSDEFAVLIDPICCPENAEAAASCLQGVVSEPFEVAGQRISVTLTQGVVTGTQDHEKAEDVVRDAETAMRHAKAQGRGRTVMFNPKMQQDAVQRLIMERDMRGALDRGEFFLEYQPIVSLETAELQGFEALVRWQHPELGRVRPDLFIGLAEETGLIVELGAWVLDEAVGQIAEWNRRWQPRHDGASLTMNVNLSKRQLADPDITATVARTLRRHGVSPAVVKLEVTESVIMGYRNDLPVLNQIRELGVQLAMDDFGTGHSSLACLHQFPIDVLKIDRAFVMNLDDRMEYAAVVQAIVMLAKNLGMLVVAEGIETSEQLAQLQALDCDCGQGYLFAKPLPVSEVGRYLDEPRLMAAS